MSKAEEKEPPIPKRIRNTISITRPNTVKWLHSETKSGKSLSDAVADAVEDMLRLQEEVNFLRQVLLRGGIIAQEETRQEQQEEVKQEQQKVEPEGWDTSALEEYQ